MVLRMERSRGNLKVDAVTLACCADLVDPLAARALVSRALIVLEQRLRAERAR